MWRQVVRVGGLVLIGVALVIGFEERQTPDHSLAYLEPHSRDLTLHVDGRTYDLAVNPHGQRSTPASVVASPDGEWLAFAVYSEVYKVRRDGTALQHLTTLYPSDFWLVYGLAWSPDGQHLLATLASPAFEKHPPPRHTSAQRPAPQVTDGVFVIDADGSHVQLVTVLPYRWTAPAVWTPDGRWVLVVTLHGITRSRPDGSDTQAIYEAEPFRVTTPLVMAPDGRWVAMGGDKGQLLLVRMDGSDVIQPDVVGVTNLAWSPSGRCLAYVAARAIWCYQPEGMPVQVYALNDLRSHPLLWSPDGRWLGYLSYQPSDNIWALLEVDVDTGATRTRQPIPQMSAWVPPVARETWHGAVWTGLGLALMGLGVRWRQR